MGLFNVVFDEMNAVVDVLAEQTLGMKPSKKKQQPRKSKPRSNRPIVNIYKEIHQHRHFHDYKAFEKALKQKK